MKKCLSLKFVIGLILAKPVLSIGNRSVRTEIELVMVALWNRTDHYIFILWFSFYLSIFFSSPNLTCIAAAHWMSTKSPYSQTWCGPSANLECRSETCCARLAENAGPKKSPKFGHLCAIAQLCRAISSQLRHVSTIGKLVKQQYLLAPTIW